MEALEGTCLGLHLEIALYDMLMVLFHDSGECVLETDDAGSMTALAYS